MFLTGQRRRQFSHLKWSYIDFEENNINWPAEAMKAKQAHFIPMTGSVAHILSVHPRGSEYVFPARGSDQPFSGWSKSLKSFHKASKTSDWTLHDLRRTVSTLLAQLGTAPHVIDALTAHTGTIGKVARIYNRYQYRAEMLAALERIDAIAMDISKTLLDARGRIDVP